MVQLMADMADYTEANERLFLGKKANKTAARRLQGEIGEMIADRSVAYFRYRIELTSSEADAEDDEETREWEEAQVRRGGTWEAEKPIAKQPKQTYAAAPSGDAMKFCALQADTQSLLPDLYLRYREHPHALRKLWQISKARTCSRNIIWRSLLGICLCSKSRRRTCAERSSVWRGNANGSKGSAAGWSSWEGSWKKR
jgi:hypothetical protein